MNEKKGSDRPAKGIGRRPWGYVGLLGYFPVSSCRPTSIKAATISRIAAASRKRSVIVDNLHVCFAPLGKSAILRNLAATALNVDRSPALVAPLVPVI